MSVIIARYGGIPEQQGRGEWFSIDGAPGGVQVLRGTEAAAFPGPEAAAFPGTEAAVFPGPEAHSAAEVWRGVPVVARGTPRRGRFVYHLRFPVPPQDSAEFVTWYTEEHLPLLLTEPTWYAGELLQAAAAGPYSFAALHYLESKATLQSPVLARSRQAEGWLRLGRHAWFDKPFLRLHLHAL